MGATQEKIATVTEQARGRAAVPYVERVSSFAEAVNLARDLAEPGNVVVLSPGMRQFRLVPQL